LNNSPVLSIIVPILNESEGLKKFVDNLLPLIDDAVELIFVDGGSTDGTLEQLDNLDQIHSSIKVISSDKGRAVQMNAGAAIATGLTLLFLHADSHPPLAWTKHIENFIGQGQQWGRFNVRLDNKGFAYRVISWFINHRSRLTGIATGDQGIFVRREVFESIDGYKNQALMEDVDLSNKLKKLSRPYCINDPIMTSSRKWENEGVIRTVWLMWRLRAAYAMGKNIDQLAERYYKNN